MRILHVCWNLRRMRRIHRASLGPCKNASNLSNILCDAGKCRCEVVIVRLRNAKGLRSRTPRIFATSPRTSMLCWTGGQGNVWQSWRAAWEIQKTKTTVRRQHYCSEGEQEHVASISLSGFSYLPTSGLTRTAVRTSVKGPGIHKQATNVQRAGLFEFEHAVSTAYRSRPRGTAVQT